jgi:hypothetical protein
MRGERRSTKEETVMEGAEFSHQIRRTAITTLALAAGLVFGIVLLAMSDWIPGAIIVAVTGVGLAREVPVIRKLCSTDWPTSPPTSKPAS